MESDNVDMGGSGGGPVNSRWSPTKEQISMLESLYRQGIRTPSAEQIQQITSRLKAFGHIEGKNVFYWFQNHKARQRQKQKQESIAYINRYLHNPHQPLFTTPPCPNVVRGPCYLPQGDLGFSPQYPKVLLPSGLNRRPKAENVDNIKAYAFRGYDPAALSHEYNNIIIHKSDRNQVTINSNSNQETLPLFPLHPTGILQGRNQTTMCSLASTSADNSITTTPSGSSETTTGNEKGSGDKPFYDFFSA